MRLFFANSEASSLFHPRSTILTTLRETIQIKGLAEETLCPEKADAIVFQENHEYKNHRYIDRLLHDTFVSAHLNKMFTVSSDDSATGLFRGIYAAIPNRRFDFRFHRTVPYIRYTNEFVFSDHDKCEPSYLAGWYGNTKSNTIRKRLVDKWKDHPSFLVKKTQSWYDHKEDEQREYVRLIKDCKFSLCPAGWAAPSPRIYESMALGRCPVIISDEFVRPAGPNWSEFALFFPQKDMSQLESFLLAYEPIYKEMGTKANEAWQNHFSGDKLALYYAETLLDLIRTTARFTKDQEVKRWRSFSTNWNNNWTIPQRLMNKYKKLVKKRAA